MKSALEQFCTEKLIERKNQIIKRQAARLAGECGTSLKPPDLLAAWICGPCHRNTPERSQDLANGVMRTIAALLADGWTFEPPNHMSLK